jgi:hypothetical protein
VWVTKHICGRQPNPEEMLFFCGSRIFQRDLEFNR